MRVAPSLLVVFLLGSLACRRNPEIVKPDEGKKGAPRVVCSIPDDDPIAKPVEVPARCDLSIKKTRRIAPGGKLTIGEGAKLTFADGAGLFVEGGVLLARGTKEEPIVFTGASAKPGAWIGIVVAGPLGVEEADKVAMQLTHVFAGFHKPTLPTPAAAYDAAGAPPVESTIQHAIVEHAGAGRERYLSAGVSVVSRDDRLFLSDVRFRKNARAGLHVAYASSLVSGAGLVFDPEDVVSLDAEPLLVARLASASFGGPVRMRGHVEEHVVLPKVDAGFIAGSLYVGGDRKKAASLAFAEGSVVRFEREARLHVGRVDMFSSGTTTCSDAFTAKKVTFTSAAEKKAPGDWPGIEIGNACSATIEDSVFEFAGWKSAGVVSVPFEDAKVSLVRNTFRDVGTGSAAIDAADCKRWSDPAKKNVTTGTLCHESSWKKPLSVLFGGGTLDTAALSALGSSSLIGTGGSEWQGGFGTSGSGLLGPKLGDGGGGGGGGGGYGDGVGLGAIGTGKGVSGGTGSGYGSAGGTIAGKPSPKIKEVSFSTAGKLPPEVVRRIVRMNMARLRACYVKGLAATPTLAGTISAKLTIAASGGVSSAAVTGGTLTDATVTSCVASTLKTLSFPEPESGTVDATFTHQYSPE